MKIRSQASKRLKISYSENFISYEKIYEDKDKG